MNRDKKIGFTILGVVAALAIFYFFTWGLVIEIGHDFSYILPADYDCHEPDPPLEERIFIPDHYWFDYNSRQIPTLIIVNFVYWQSLPCDLQIDKGDPTYLESHENFKSFVYDSIKVRYSDGQTVVVVDRNTPIEDRSFDVDLNGPNIVYKNAITEKKDFDLIMIGTATKIDGTTIPFESTSRYEHERLFRVYTYMDLIGSI